jgi:hypothetical protein
MQTPSYRPDSADQPCTCDPGISRRQCAERDEREIISQLDRDPRG